MYTHPSIQLSIHIYKHERSWYSFTGPPASSLQTELQLFDSGSKTLKTPHVRSLEQNHCDISGRTEDEYMNLMMPDNVETFLMCRVTDRRRRSWVSAWPCWTSEAAVRAFSSATVWVFKDPAECCYWNTTDESELGHSSSQRQNS